MFQAFDCIINQLLQEFSNLFDLCTLSWHSMILIQAISVNKKFYNYDHSYEDEAVLRPINNLEALK